MSKYNTRFLNSHTFYFMRLQPYRRYQKPIYKIVVTNQNNRIVSTLGYYNPFKIKFRITYKKLSQPLFAGKVIAIDRTDTLLWLRKGVIPSIFLSFLLRDMGLLKTQSSSVSNELQILKKQVNKILPILSDELL